MNYKKLGLKIGLEIHQQLSTNKLYCSCPSELQEGKPSLTIKRELHAVAGELGDIDPAALQAYLKGKTYTYNFFDECNCLIELDEAPPKTVNQEALETVLNVSLLLNANILDEIHVMRKTGIDGSNVSGFQRTSLIAINGTLAFKDVKIGIPSICLEEDAARKIEEKKGEIVYNLDRLGIPLIELATTPDIRTPEETKVVARAIGDILRATKKVKRGIGTIRQDLNVSIKDGARVELKGIQDLNLLPKVVENEIQRQLNLVKIRDELKKRNAKTVFTSAKDVSNVFKNSKSKVIQSALKQNKVVYALKLEKFSKLLGMEIQENRRFGTELSDYAKAYGAKGLFHLDELPGYGITKKEVEEIKKKLNLNKDDSFVLIADSKEVCEKALKAVAERASFAITGVPEETRKALPDGNSAYMRPLPGASRMYPETDLEPVVITKKNLDELSKSVPKLPWEEIDDLCKKYSITTEIASNLYKSRYFHLFKKIVAEIKVDPKVVAVTFTNTLPSLDDFEILQEKHFEDLFKAFAKGQFSKEAIPNVLETWIKSPDKTLPEILTKLGIEKMSKEKLEKIVDKVISENKKLIEERKKYAIKPLMGIIMKEVRGKVAGNEVIELLKKKIK